MPNEFQTIDSGDAILKNDYMGEAMARRKKKVAVKSKSTDNKSKSKGKQNGLKTLVSK